MFRISEIDKLYKSCLAIGNFNVKQKRILVLSMEVVNLGGSVFDFVCQFWFGQHIKNNFV